MTLQNKFIGLCLMLLLGFAMWLGVRAHLANVDRIKEQNTALELANKSLNQYKGKVVERDAKIAALNTDLSNLDTEHTKALDEELTENAALRTDLAVAKRMRLQGASCVRGPAVGEALSAGSVGDAGTVELSDATRQAVFDIRAGIQRDRRTILYLYDYLEQNGLTAQAVTE